MEDLHVAGRGREVCWGFALPRVGKSVAHRGQDRICLWVWWPRSPIIGSLEAGLIQTWGKSASDLVNSVLNSHFHLMGL